MPKQITREYLGISNIAGVARSEPPAMGVVNCFHVGPHPSPEAQGRTILNSRTLSVGHSRLHRMIHRWMMAMAVLAAWPQGIAAGQPPQPPQPPAGRPAPAQSVVDSPEWQATRQAFQDWLTVQQVYSDQEVQTMVNDLRTRVATMNEQERAAFLKDMQARLAVLNSEQATQARAWMSENMSRMTPAGQQKLRRQIPDVANMSAAQLQQALAAKQMQMQGRQQSQAATAQFRAQQNQMAMQMNQQRQQAFTDARQRQQSAVSSQATNRVQQGFQQSQHNSRNNIGTPGGNAPLFNPFIWANPWVY